VAWKALAALGILAVGAVAAVATVYSLGWRENGREVERITTRSTPRTAGAQVYTVRYGDEIRVPDVGMRCLASGEGGFPNFLCFRIPRGRHSVSFYNDSFLVWLTARGPSAPEASYHWKPESKAQ
jgi:hypothetical protein